ncbi:delta-1-pyrroline-5-carboxylate dehydrogenase [Lineolata rhizophorae]|uniref:Multifunctional fusion protein n=1 Tax=Lineolata rhizophorae TaxID=578093 RepID=A0A6A6PBC7_9PEZI|nr:delta-1-pyrroline-5-carboxylate dehydrogenase [Lineolata rhizophorae]
MATFKVPSINNEPNLHYAKGSPDRQKLADAMSSFRKTLPVKIPLFVGGKEVTTQSTQTQFDPSNHSTVVAECADASASDVGAAIDSALAARPSWESMPFADRAAIFLKAADLISSKYRFDVMAATMIGQGKNAWQAEIDSAAELCDFLRFNVRYAEELYGQQPVHNSPGVWNRVEYRALEGFVYAVTPFNFTAIGGNLPAAPALMGNVVLWKPSPSALASNHLVLRILLEAGLPPDVIQFVPGDAETVTAAALGHKNFAALHYTGSTAVFRHLYGEIGKGVAEARYAGYPRVVAETGGKNFHLVHRSADVQGAVVNTVRAAFEFAGQKCSACSRAYVARSLWPEFKQKLVREVEAIKVGPPDDFANFVGPVIHKAAFERLSAVIDDAKADQQLELLVGGAYDGSKGYFVRPTVYATTDPAHPLLSRELFGPVVVVYVYDDERGGSAEAAFADACALVDATSAYGLTGAVFARDRAAVRAAEDALRHAAGNFYINAKCTGAVVGQQPFGGARASGTNDKAGSANLLSRFVSMRAVKEEFVPPAGVEYPSNAV